MTKILIIDDHATVRKGIQNFLDATPSMQIVGEAKSTEEALHLINAQEFDIALLDLEMYDRSEVDILIQIKKTRPKLPVLVLSMHSESRQVLKMLNDGASGYIQKDTLATELISAIQSNVRGRRYISSTLADLLTLTAEPQNKTEKPLHENLSEREHEVFMRLSKGQAITNIAQDLGISVKTVSTYRTRVLEKMSMNNNADIIYYAIKQKLIS